MKFESCILQILRKYPADWDEIAMMVFQFYGGFVTPEDNKPCNMATIDFYDGTVEYANIPHAPEGEPSFYPADAIVLARYRIKIELIPINPAKQSDEEPAGE